MKIEKQKCDECGKEEDISSQYSLLNIPQWVHMSSFNSQLDFCCVRCAQDYFTKQGEYIEQYQAKNGSV